MRRSLETRSVRIVILYRPHLVHTIDIVISLEQYWWPDPTRDLTYFHRHYLFSSIFISTSKCSINTNMKYYTSHVSFVDCPGNLDAFLSSKRYQFNCLSCFRYSSLSHHCEHSHWYALDFLSIFTSFLTFTYTQPHHQSK